MVPRRLETAATQVLSPWARAARAVGERRQGHGGRPAWPCHIVEHEDNEMRRPYQVGGCSQGNQAEGSTDSGRCWARTTSGAYRSTGAGGATETPWAPFLEIAWATKPDAFTSSTNARR